MALNTLEFDIHLDAATANLAASAHIGVAGSGDMEVLMTPQDLGGSVQVRIVTPVVGFDDLWQRVLNGFVGRYALANARIEINDNNATPAVVLLRLNQALSEASGK
ncbi:Malonate decarboxylase acyl carrier protein [Rhodovastum atsumiense]|uniref:Malonate decarboxylase acyl carrier protein n=1 Tax=Rhodovastum atsumiense TaxID=504468 RepID=A0A5M6ILD0_9PROT|nr:malonate decarboxylase acyl carrier protein [Rhodovastum atsumiense]KAA5608972.1 malonate decarboxylase acyl carrier protein [Rhodovastum atsumiense]CAH2603683.1 Malonate decarboxylase acyl carrier protein [Rhodovastum atsumiense]